MPITENQCSLTLLLQSKYSSWLLVVLCLTLVVACTATPQATVVPPVPAKPQQPKGKIGIDPGHGWRGDPGAIGVNGLQEKDVTLRIGLLTKEILERNGFQVVMSRNGDDEHDLTRVREIMNEENPRIVVSIHANCCGNSTGTEACYTVGKNTDSESRVLAQLMTDSISTKLSLSSRGIFPENADDRCARKKSTGWNQLYIHDLNAPSVIIETAFLTNPNDADMLQNRSQDFAQAIADVITAYLSNSPLVLAPLPQPSVPPIVVTIVPATVPPTLTSVPKPTLTSTPKPTPIPTVSPFIGEWERAPQNGVLYGWEKLRILGNGATIASADSFTPFPPPGEWQPFNFEMADNGELLISRFPNCCSRDDSTTSVVSFMPDGRLRVIKTWSWQCTIQYGAPSQCKDINQQDLYYYTRARK